MDSWSLHWFLFLGHLLMVSGWPIQENFDLNTNLFEGDIKLDGPIQENFDIDAGTNPDIIDINEDLDMNLFEGDIKLDGPIQENFDIDGGTEQDIFYINADLDLNLFEGDIKLDGAQDRNAIIGEQYKWPHSIPYILDSSLEVNAKAVILQAFERYRLKTCLDFKPWDGEKNYIAVFKGSGCWSSVGNKREGRQELSIGRNCDRIAIVQHEFLHALGFWHEQSRSDRDDYIWIMWNKITPGREHNFNVRSDRESDFLNVPYDYNSVLHYSKTAFSRDSDPTILTKVKEFEDMIGQRMDFSDYDLQKLNQLYNCSSSLSFMDSCDFELENICGMIQSEEDKIDWQRVSHVSGGPENDYSNMGRCKGSGFFMHFNSSSVDKGHTAVMETRALYPKRNFQCLEFYLYNSGSKNDSLNIYVRKYAAFDIKGHQILVKQIKDIPTGYWQLYYVTLNMTNKFRVVFEGRRGSGESSGGLSIDNINLSETQCPHHVWHIRNFTKTLSSKNEHLLSPPFYSPKGYAFQIQFILIPWENAQVYVHLISGHNDDKLKWPCPWQQVTVILLDQNSDIRRRMSNQLSVTTDPYMIDDKHHFWDRPSKVGTKSHYPNGTEYMKNRGYGTSIFISHKRLYSREFIKGNDVYLLLTMNDVSHLAETQEETAPAPSDTNDLCSAITCENGGICTTQDGTAECWCPSGEDWWYTGERCEKRGSTRDMIVITVSSAAAVFVLMLIVTLISIYCTRRRYRQKTSSNIANVTLENQHHGF